MDYDFTSATAATLRTAVPPTVILAARWSVYLEWGVATDDHFPTTTQAKVDGFVHALSQTLSLLRDAGAKDVWTLREVPYQPCDVPRALATAKLLGRSGPLAKTELEYHADMSLADLALQQVAAPDVRMVDLSPLLYQLSNLLLTSDDKPMYSDSNHISASGAMILRKGFEPIVQAAVLHASEH